MKSSSKQSIWNTGKPSKYDSEGVILAKVDCPAQDSMLQECFFDEDGNLMDLSTGNSVEPANAKWFNFSNRIDNDITCLKGILKAIQRQVNHDITLQEEIDGINEWIKELKEFKKSI